MPCRWEGIGAATPSIYNEPWRPPSRRGRLIRRPTQAASRPSHHAARRPGAAEIQQDAEQRQSGESQDHVDQPRKPLGERLGRLLVRRVLFDVFPVRVARQADSRRRRVQHGGQRVGVVVIAARRRLRVAEIEPQRRRPMGRRRKPSCLRRRRRAGGLDLQRRIAVVRHDQPQPPGADLGECGRQRRPVARRERSRRSSTRLRRKPVLGSAASTK